MSTKTASKPAIPEIASKVRNGLPLSPAEVAVFSGTHPESVRRAIRQGRLPASRIGGARDIRILPTGLAAWLQIPVAELVPSSN